MLFPALKLHRGAIDHFQHNSHNQCMGARNAKNKTSKILQLKKNCWQLCHSPRVSVLIDASNYYRSLYEAFLRAEAQIIILGWDTDSRMKLLQDDPNCPAFGEFLSQLLKQKPNLKIHILSWDFAFIYALEREALPKMKFGLAGDERLEFFLDNHHPLGASQHQKIVVVDDQIAFSGGLDITGRRWDTPEHKAHDDRRLDPGGTHYAPFHDVQIAVSGASAKSLGDIARERWKIATGVNLATPKLESPTIATPIWPQSAETFLENVQLGISRTLPLYQNRRPIYEVERLFHDSIAAAKNFIYIENQYFTSDEISKCLSRRLREADGPEVVLVLPCDNSGWLEENTMGILRARALDRLKLADKYGRLRVLHPIVPNLPEDKYLQVHSKVMIVDDRFMRIGSANLSQRSMGFDSECDVSIEAEAGSANEFIIRSKIAWLRARLLGEHLDVAPSEVEDILQETKSLVATVDSLRGRERTLVELNWKIPEWVDRLLPETELIDPPRPYRPSKILRRWFQALLSKPRNDYGYEF